jgi:hypothetical protein
MQPAKHLSAYMKTKANIIDTPNAAKMYIQLFFISLMKSPKYPELEALAKLEDTEENKLVNIELLGTHILPSKEYES